MGQASDGAHPTRHKETATMLPDLVILCCRCGTVHPPHALSRMSTGADGAAPGKGCAVAIAQGTGQGGYGSAVVDLDTITLSPAAGLGTSTGFLCDGCCEALEHLGLLHTLPRAATAAHTTQVLEWGTDGSDAYGLQAILGAMMQRKPR
jgi:hypothetical protein